MEDTNKGYKIDRENKQYVIKFDRDEELLAFNNELKMDFETFKRALIMDVRKWLLRMGKDVHIEFEIFSSPDGSGGSPMLSAYTDDDMVAYEMLDYYDRYLEYNFEGVVEELVMDICNTFFGEYDVLFGGPGAEAEEGYAIIIE